MSELIRVTHDEAGDLDEFVARGVNVHLERMDDCDWWMAVDFDNGETWHINLGAIIPRAKGYARAEKNA